ncbi:MAG: D-lyxose/D-mannose family sugar isomerase [Clostridia bacterium]|nr:D-lyxose/D-mannose family sugar isomerase [Clostridia bacterium]
MKRSELNRLILENRAFIESQGFKLPPFAYWGIEEWKNLSEEYKEMRDCQIGWDVTDFGSGDFYKVGLFLLTIRNGCFGKYPKPYAEKIMVVEEEQVTPMHFHWKKMEDIINRGGGNLLIKVYNSTKDEQLDLTGDVTIYSDGRQYTVPAGSIVCLKPGQSMTMQQGLYHSFWGEKGKGKVMVGEVSMCNDDTNDNRFYEPTGRFSDIEEDVAAEFLLVNEL